MIHPFSRFGGVETWINEVSKRLVKKRYDVILSKDTPNLNSRMKKTYIWFKYKLPKNVDVVHLHDFSLGVIKIKGKIPIVSTYHGSSWARFKLIGQKKAFISGLMEKIRYKFSDINIAVSREIQRWYPNSIYIPNGVDHKKFVPNGKKIKIDSNKIKIVWVGRIDKIKGYDKLNILKEYFTIIEAYNVPYEKISEYYRAGDVFVLPSLYEGMPLTALEAMACGLPVVAYRVGGLPDIVFDGFNGYLVEPGNTKELVEKTKLAFENKKQLGKNGRWLVEKIFNWDYVTKRYIEIYESFL